MNLIEQLRARKVAIDKGGEFEDVKRVLDYAFPEDRGNLLNCWRNDMYYLAMDVNGKYYYHYCTLPEGMKAIDVKEFLKEMDVYELPFNYEGFGKGELHDIYEAEKERADKAEAKLKELQPFERGVKGWVLFEGCKTWSNMKYEYIGIIGKFHFVYNLGLGCKRVKNFQTENPHKKETVFDCATMNYQKIIDDCDVVTLHKDSNGYLTLTIIKGGYDTVCVHATQIGTDLQSKFDDQNNDKYISLIK